MDLTARLPDGCEFDFWEVKQEYERELHVACNHPHASDDNDGSMDHPYKTINAAAAIATPGTRVWIHGGEYRECVRPAQGGENPERMICYEAYGDGEVIIKASIEVTEFEKSKGWRLSPNFDKIKDEDLIQVWQIRLNPEDFKGYNPFCLVNILHDRLFIEYDKTDMTTYLNRRGMIFCDGKPLQQVALYNQLSQQEGSFWVEANGQTVHFRLKNDDHPSNHRIELTSREQCFAPEVPFLSYIKLKGLTCAHAATGAPVPQRGAISCYRGHHWIIEDCEIDWSNAVGIDIGNECWHHDIEPGQLIGYSIIRGCRIRNVGVCGIAALFAEHYLIEDNIIEGTGWQKMELSWEAGAMKAHNSIGCLIRRNIFTKTYRADHLWLDCGNENNRITQNLFLDGIEQREAIFIECTRDGVNLIDNNIFWNVEGRFDPQKIPKEPGSSGWYKLVEHDVINGYAIYGEGTDHLYIANNLIGNCRGSGYYAKPVAFRMHGLLRGGTSRDARLFNNIFYQCGEAAITMPTEKNEAEGNLYVKQTGGYLRVMYPAPEACLDLPAWKEFYGFDLQGQEGWFDIEINTETYTMELKKAENGLRNVWRQELEKHQFIYDPSDIKEVENASLVSNDFYGTATKDEKRSPGPFHKLQTGEVYSIDPRKSNK
ncbi:right-handed parallel beta-helix repeat-containing protein [Lachnospiraceae bacterium MD1]|uniref:Right-handed parallel beta-helix repeat-containing protein n=1 Tax=Variimorphobacter saccharofermentans TaxID=2755051 RepID=A0A839K493_9FIRM|nr:right-handed parallel beta-helix repeat-containing protein [Variimorphobacter saccharofermentans]MBB2183859.1 right-handed parallel beta-helix repeat-containing protein [Variimorphobacter saccharofermentans]